MFVGEAGAYPIEETFGGLLALATNNSLVCKGLPGDKPSSLLRKYVTYGRKKFHNTGPRRYTLA